MPTVYRQISTRSEWRRGTFSLRLSVSDDYTALFMSEPDATVKEVVCVKVSTLKEDLEDEEGKFVEDELSVEVDSLACVGANDAEVLALMLECVDPAQERFILMEIAEGGSSTYVQRFRGVLRPDVQGSDTRWYGAEYGSNPTPERVYKFTAKSYSTAVMEKSLDALVPPTPTSTGHPLWSAWASLIYSTAVKHYLASSGAYDVSTGTGEYDFSAIYFPEMVDINDALRYYADRIEDIVGDPGFSIIIAESPIAMTFGTPSLAYQNNYALGPEYFGDLSPVIEHRTTNVRNDIKLGDGQEGFLVSLRMMQPVIEKNIAYSFLRSKTFAQLCYDLARSVGMFAIFEYDDDGNLVISFKSRENVFKDAAGDVKNTYLRDADSGSIKSQPTTINAEKDKYSGYANGFALEGADIFKREDGEYVRSELAKANRTDDKMLAVTIGATLLDTYEPAFGTKYRKLWNTSWWLGNDAGTDPPASHTITVPVLSYDDSALATTIYVRTAGEIYYVQDMSGAFVPSGRTYSSIRPVTQVDVLIDGEQNTFTELAEYVNRLKGLDGAYFNNEYEISVPYVSAFRRTPSGSDSHFNIDLGSTIPLDGVDYVVVGLEFDFDNLTTKIRLHKLTRFSIFARPTEVADAAIDAGQRDPSEAQERKSNVQQFVAAEDMTAGWAVSVDSAGKVVKARPATAQYNTVVGVCLDTKVAGEIVSVCTSGVCTVPDSYSLGLPIWLRSGSPNISSTRIASPTSTEHVDQKLGTCVGVKTLEVNIGRPFIWFGFGV